MKIRIIGKEKRSRWTLEIDGKLISLCGCDYLIILSLAVVWINNNDNSLSKDYLFGDLTARYLYQFKKHISKLAGFDAKDLIINQYRNCSRKPGYYRLNVDDIIIENQAYSFDDYRFTKVLEIYS